MCTDVNIHYVCRTNVRNRLIEILIDNNDSGSDLSYHGDYDSVINETLLVLGCII